MKMDQKRVRKATKLKILLDLIIEELQLGDTQNDQFKVTWNDIARSYKQAMIDAFPQLADPDEQLDIDPAANNGLYEREEHEEFLKDLGLEPTNAPADPGIITDDLDGF